MYSMSFKEEHVRLFSHNVNISLKNARIVAGKIRKKSLREAMEYLEKLVKQEESIDGKYYTKTASELLKLLHSLRKNAEFRNMDWENLILYISPKKGTTIHRRRRKSGFGTRMKTCHVEMFAVKR